MTRNDLLDRAVRECSPGTGWGYTVLCIEGRRGLPCPSCEQQIGHVRRRYEELVALDDDRLAGQLIAPPNGDFRVVNASDYPVYMDPEMPKIKAGVRMIWTGRSWMQEPFVS
jgi:hypothetical protein